MKSQKGFTVVEGLLIVILIGLIGGTGWYVWHSNNAANKSLTNANNSSSATIQSAKNDSSNVLLKNSKLSFTYDPKAWDLKKNTSTADQYCGKQDSAKLASKQNTAFSLLFNLGSCGKGGGSCSDIPGCKVESEQLAKVSLDSDKTENKDWSYQIVFSDNPSCSDVICGFTVLNLDSGDGLISGVYDATKGGQPSSLKSLADFSKLTEVQSAAKVLQTLRYQ
jgi:type II secretory pathway pseudopilin PulG